MMPNKPKNSYPQGTQTKGLLDFEITLRFRMRPAGWANNDRYMFKRSWRLLSMHLIPLLQWTLLGDESVQIAKMRWRRPGETWQIWNEEV